MSTSPEPTAIPPSLRSLRIAAALGAVAAAALVVVGFTIGLLAGLLALFLLPLIPLLFVLGFEAIRGDRAAA